MQAPSTNQNVSTQTDPRNEVDYSIDGTLLVEPTVLVSKTLPIRSDHYWVGWKNSSGDYVAAARSGVALTLPAPHTYGPLVPPQILGL